MAQPQIFSQDALKRIIDASLPTDAKPGERIVLGTVDETGAQVVAGFHFHAARAEWELSGAARHDWDAGNTVGAKVLLRF